MGRDSRILNLGELAIVLLAALSPMYLFATSIGTDEFVKSGIGTAAAGTVYGVYRVWKGKS